MSEAKPIDVIIHCPRCRHQHIDAPEPNKGWTNPPHKSHLCHWCGAIWRPADVPTNGVASVATRGGADTYPPAPEPRVPVCKCSRCGKQLYADSCGNYSTLPTGEYSGVCMACVLPEED